MGAPIAKMLAIGVAKKGMPRQKLRGVIAG